MPNYKQINRVLLRDITEFKKVSMDFHFELGSAKDEIVFVKNDMVFKLNFLNSIITPVYKFKTPFKLQPHTFEMNDDHTIAVISSNDRIKYVDFALKDEMNIHDEIPIELIRNVVYD